MDITEENHEEQGRTIAGVGSETSYKHEFTVQHLSGRADSEGRG